MVLPLRCCPWTGCRLIGVLLSSALLLALGPRVHAQQPQAGEVQGERSTELSDPSTLVGHVLDADGQPIADAKVRVVIPSADLRFAVNPKEHRELWVETDPTGSYSIEVEGIDKECTASVDILHPGHRRLVGTLMSGGSPNEVKLSPGGRAEFNARLPEALYFAGRVVDEANNPIEGVSVLSALNSPTSSAGVERSVTDSDGRFAVYCYESRMFEDEGFLNRGKTTATVRFQHDRYISADLRKLEDLEPANRDELRVTMDAGSTIAGSVIDADGKAAADMLISIVNRLIQEANAPTIPPGAAGNTSAWIETDGTAKVRVVYLFENESVRGTNTQYMRLEPRDVAELVTLQQRMRLDAAN